VTATLNGPWAVVSGLASSPFVLLPQHWIVSWVRSRTQVCSPPSASWASHVVDPPSGVAPPTPPAAPVPLVPPAPPAPPDPPPPSMSTVSPQPFGSAHWIGCLIVAPTHCGAPWTRTQVWISPLRLGHGWFTQSSSSTIGSVSGVWGTNERERRAMM